MEVLLNNEGTPTTDSRLAFEAAVGILKALGVEVRFGRMGGFREAPDFRWDSATEKLYTRSLILADKGDCPDLALRRAGPDNSGYDGEPAPALPGQSCGPIYWQAWGSNGRWSSDHGLGRLAQIDGVVADHPTTTRSGMLKVSLSPPNGHNAERAFQLAWPGDGTNETALMTIFQDGQNLRFERVRVGPPNSAGQGWRTLKVPN